MLTLDKCKITVTPEIEDITVEQVAKECGPGFIEAVRAQRKKSRKWGWCVVNVTVSIPGLPGVEGAVYLGCCSYVSKKDFIENSGYYAQMLKEAFEECQKSFEEAYRNYQALGRVFKKLGVNS